MKGAWVTICPSQLHQERLSFEVGGVDCDFLLCGTYLTMQCTMCEEAVKEEKGHVWMGNMERWSNECGCDYYHQFVFRETHMNVCNDEEATGST